MTAIELPAWTLTAPLERVERAARDGSISWEQFDAYFAIWRYSAPRFADYFGWPSVREVNARLDRIYGIQ